MRCIFALVLLSLFLCAPVRAQQIKVGITGSIGVAATCDGVVYFGCSDGKLYAVNAADGSIVQGFPVNVETAAGDGVTDHGPPPSVYYGALGKAIYAETSKHGIVKVWPDGKVAWFNKLDDTASIIGTASPAVTPTGDVIAEMKSSTTMYLVKLKESDGSLVCTSPALADTGGDSLSSPAVVDNNVYVTVGHHPATNRKIFVLNLNDLTVKANLAGTGWEGVIPYARGNGIYIGSSTDDVGTVFKMNSVTLAPDPLFGVGLYPNIAGATLVDVYRIGHVSVGISGAPRSADRDAGGTIYAYLGNSQYSGVVAIDAVSGAVRTLRASGQPEGGMVVSSRSVIAHCSGNTLDLWRVDGGSPRSYTLDVTPFEPVYDPTTNRFFVVTWKDSTGKSYLMGFDSP